MRTIVAYTAEIDDLDEAVEELFEQVEGFPLAANTLAMLYTEEDTDYPALYARLSKKWSFPVMGCTAMAMLADEQGYCRGGISVMLLTADDCEFTVGISGEFKQENYREQVRSLYETLTAQQSSEAKLAIGYCGIEVTEQVVTGGNVLAVLDEVSGGLPVYGGTASDNLTFTGFRVFYNDRVVRDGMVLALLSGNVKPRFVRINSVEHVASFSYEITKAEGSVIHRLGDKSFVETLGAEGMRVDEEDAMSVYILCPFVVTVDHGNGDTTEAARILARLDLSTGAGAFLGEMPEGATLSIGLINRDDVTRTVDKAFARMFSELEKQGDEYSALLCNSCSARYLALMNNPAVEADSYLVRKPKDKPLIGIYAYGEVCPVRGEKTGREYNMYHNFTFTILAL